MTQAPREFDPNDPAGVPGSPGYTEDRYAGRVTPAGAGPEPGAGLTGLSRAESVSTTDGPAGAAGTDRSTPDGGPQPRPVTRAGMVWVAVASALVVLILLIVFILQNQDYVQVKFFGLQGAVALGIALFIAAVGGGVLVAIAGAARIIQLRLAAHRQRIKGSGRR
jgi:uncharacterized integral membrane protein